MLRWQTIEGKAAARSTREAETNLLPGGELMRLKTELQLFFVGGHRQFDCPAYEDCLSFACARQWRSWTCIRCEGPSAGWHMRQRLKRAKELHELEEMKQCSGM